MKLEGLKLFPRRRGRRKRVSLRRNRAENGRKHWGVLGQALFGTRPAFMALGDAMWVWIWGEEGAAIAFSLGRVRGWHSL